MEQKICVDTDVLIGFTKGSPSAVQFFQDYHQKASLMTTTINLYELYLGANLARNREKETKLVDTLKESLHVLPFSENTAKIAAETAAKLQQKGKMIDHRDIFIAAIATQHGCTLKTNNVKHFERIEGLSILG